VRVTLIHQHFQRILNALPFGMTCLVNQLFLQTLNYFLYCVISRRPTSLVDSETLFFCTPLVKWEIPCFCTYLMKGEISCFPCWSLERRSA